MQEKYPGISTYAYCVNNPVILVDLNGEYPFWVDFKRRQSGFSHDAPQRFLGYCDFYDKHMGKVFDIQATKFEMRGVTLRLWKGDYGMRRDKLPENLQGLVKLGAGGEIGLYIPNGLKVDLGSGRKLDLESCMTQAELVKIGLESTDLKVFNKKTGKEVASRTEDSPSFWTTSFSWDEKGKGEELYSLNTFTFKDKASATSFYKNLIGAQDRAEEYQYNYNESIVINPPNDKNQVIITWGKEQ
jgi:hypothetical protein